MQTVCHSTKRSQRRGSRPERYRCATFSNGDRELSGTTSEILSGFTLDPGVDTFTVTSTGGVDVEAFTVTLEQPEPITLDPLAPVVPGEPWTVTWSGEATDVFLSVGPETTPGIQCAGAGPSSITIPGELTAMIPSSDTTSAMLTHFGEREIDNLPSGAGVAKIVYRLHHLEVDVQAP